MLQAFGGSLHHWNEALKEVGFSSSYLIRPKHRIYQELTSLGLPTREYISFPFKGSATAHSSLIDEMNAEKLYLLIEAENGNVLLSRPQLTKNEVKNILETAASDLHCDTAHVIVIDEADMLYEGTIVVNDDGSLTGEIALSTTRGVSRGATPYLTFHRPFFLKHLTITGSEQSEDLLVKQIIQALPRSEDSPMRFIAGYYEILVCHEGHRILFHDYRNELPFLEHSTT